MSTTPNRMQNYWNESREFIKSNWPLITDSDLDVINAKFDVFLEYLEDYYNDFPKTEAIARSKLQGLFNELDEKQFQK